MLPKRVAKLRFIITPWILGEIGKLIFWVIYNKWFRWVSYPKLYYQIWNTLLPFYVKINERDKRQFIRFIMLKLSEAELNREICIANFFWLFSFEAPQSLMLGFPNQNVMNSHPMLWELHFILLKRAVEITNHWIYNFLNSETESAIDFRLPFKPFTSIW